MASAGKRMIALDTNILLAMQKFKIDVFQEAKSLFGNPEIVLPLAVKKEVEELAKKNKAARVAEIALKKEGIKIVKTGAEKADDALLELAKQNMVIATNDWELKKKIKQAGGMIIHVRKRKFLQIG